MSQLSHIIKYKLVSFVNSYIRISSSKLFKSLGSGIVYASIAFGAYLFTKNAIHFLLIDIKIGLFLLHEFISIILFIFFIAVNVGNIIVSYSTLYKSPEVTYFLSKPIDPTTIFTIKFLDNFFYSSSTLLLILFSVLAGYAAYFELSLIEFLYILFFNLFPFIFAAGSLGVIFLLLVIKSASIFGIKKVIYGLVAAYLISIFSFFKITSPVKLVNEVMQHYPNVDQYFGDLIPEVIRFLPNNWLSESLYWTVVNDFGSSIQYTTLLILFSLLLFIIALLIGRKWYLKTLLVSLKIHNKKLHDYSQKSKFLSFEKLSFLNTQTESIIKKELLLFLREPSQLIHFTILLFLISIFLSSLSGVAFIGTYNYTLQAIVYLVLFLFNTLLITTLALRFVFPLISLEGESFWKIKTSPLDNTKFVKLKLMPFFLIIFIVSQLLSYFSNSYFSIELTFVTGILMTFVSITLVLMNFGMGGIFAVYKEKNPIRISSSQGASLTFLFSLIYMIFLVACLLMPVSKYFQGLRIAGIHYLGIIYYIVAVIGIVSAIVSILFYSAALKSLRKDF